MVEPGIVVGMSGGHPFEQMASADEKPEQRADYGVDHQPSLMGQERDKKCALHQAKGEIAAQRAQMIAERYAATVRNHAGNRGQQRR